MGLKEAGNPIISFDTKKKEVLGNLYRPGTLYTTEPVTTLDHDFWSLGHGKVIPHGIFDEYLPKWNYRAVPQLTH